MRYEKTDYDDGPVPFKLIRSPWASGFRMDISLVAGDRNLEYSFEEDQSDEHKPWNYSRTRGSFTMCMPLHMMTTGKIEDFFPSMGSKHFRFLNVTEACFSRLGDYWKDTEGRTIEQFIAWAVESHEHTIGDWDKQSFLALPAKSASKRAPSASDSEPATKRSRPE